MTDARARGLLAELSEAVKWALNYVPQVKFGSDPVQFYDGYLRLIRANGLAKDFLSSQPPSKGAKREWGDERKVREPKEARIRPRVP